MRLPIAIAALVSLLLAVACTTDGLTEAERHNNKGFDLAAEGRWEEAIAEYDKAIELDPEFAAAYNNRGRAYYEMGDVEQAIADHDKAIELNPDYTLAYYNRGVIHYLEEEYEQALADLSKAIELDPEFAAAYANRGFAYRDSGELGKAITDLEKAIELDPSLSDELQSSIDIILDALRNQAQAEQHNNRGLNLAQEGRWEEAISEYDKAIKLHPGFAAAYKNRGLAYAELGDVERAIANLEQALAFESDPSTRAELEETIEQLKGQ